MKLINKLMAVAIALIATAVLGLAPTIQILS